MAARLQLFGAIQLTSDGGAPIGAVKSNRLQSLLAFLVLKAGTPQSKEHLAALLWPESEDSQARTNLRQLLHNLRRAVPPDACPLSTDHQTVHWPRDADCSVDVHEFDEALARGTPDDLAHAVDLYQDDLAQGLYDDWLTPLREQYRLKYSHALEQLAAFDEARGDLPGAIRLAERLISHDPLRETHHQLLIRLFLAQRDKSSALRAYHQCMRVMRRELGVDPDPVTRELYQRALEDRSAAVPARANRDDSAGNTSQGLVGREREMAALRDLWLRMERPSGSREPHLAVILGEPGIGKSRLAEEFVDWCAARPVSASVSRARCYAAQGQLAYAPVAEWLRAAPLQSACSRLPPSQHGELARVLPEIFAGDSTPSPTASRPLAESWERRHFFESLHAAFALTARPLLLLIDDLQWCDEDTIDYLQAFLRAPGARQALVVATLRPEEIDRSHPAARLRMESARTSQLTEIPLRSLSKNETASLATQTAGEEMNPEDLAELHRTTQGNPLFVVECIRAGLRNPEGVRRIHAVISSRLARLSPEAYELAGLAAEAGRSFSFDLLAKASDWDEASLTRGLDELWQRRLIDGIEDGALYDFTHDRIREVAASELSPVRKRFFHRRIARALEELHAGDTDSVSLQLARHYDEAGMPNEAIACYRQTAVVAQRRFADREAAQCLERALELCARFPESAARRERELDLLVSLGPVLVTHIGYSMPGVGDTYGRALKLSRELGEKRHLPFILSGSWVFHVVRGDLLKSEALSRQLLELALADGNAALEAAGTFTLGSSLYHLGRLPESLALMERTMANYGNVSHAALRLFAGPDVGVFCQSYIGHLRWHAGQEERSVEAAREAIEFARRVGHPFSMAIAQDYAALLHTFRQEPGLALEHANEAIAVCARHEFAYYHSIAEIVAGWALAFTGDTSSGLGQLRTGIERLRATGAEIRLPFYHGLLAEVLARKGNLGEALANVSTGFAYQTENGETWASSDLYRIQGDLLVQSGSGDQARVCYGKAIEAARQNGSKPLEIRAERRLAGI